MLKPERMQRVSIVVRRTDRAQAIAALAEANALHIIDHEPTIIRKTSIDIGTPEEGADVLAEALTRTRSLLKDCATTQPDRTSLSVSERIARIEDIVEKHNASLDAAKDARATIERLEKESSLLDLLPAMDEPVETLFAPRGVEMLLVRKMKTGTLDALHPIFIRENEAQGTALVCVAKEDGSLDGVLKASRLTAIDLSVIAHRTGTVPQVRAQIGKEEEIAKTALGGTGTQIDPQDIAFLLESEQVLAFELLKAQAPLRFGSTSRITIITGFVPASKCDALASGLGADALIEFTHAQEAPTKLDNPHGTQSFEALIKLYTLPKYNEIDPTSLMAITFPVFFGFMLGDIGYGVCLLGLFAWLKRKYSAIEPFANIIILSAVSTIIFGLVYGEVFGLEQLFSLHLPHLVHRSGDFATMAITAIVFGIAHLNFGLLLGMYNESRAEGWAYAIAKKGSWMPLQAGTIILLNSSGMTADLPVISSIAGPALLGWILVALGVVGIIAFERLQGVLELPMIFSHTLSYLRLVAIGLASVSLAVVVNGMGGDLVSLGGAWIALGIAIIVLGHTLNLALGLLGPFLHSLRLHYAEFFMKFYEGGGTAYVPFGGVNYER